ncbi:MAG: hypothetical protein NTX73_03160 [Rhodobacterales bacterium]|jgi:hypothetical protein|nr:hypothetical protein [Rhodobacterales bacterium]
MTTKDINSGCLVRPLALSVPVREALHLASPEAGMEHPHTATCRDRIIDESQSYRPQVA